MCADEGGVNKGKRGCRGRVVRLSVFMVEEGHSLAKEVARSRRAVCKGRLDGVIRRLYMASMILKCLDGRLEWLWCCPRWARRVVYAPQKYVSHAQTETKIWCVN